MGLVSFEDVTKTIKFPLRLEAISVPLRGDRITFTADGRILVFVVTDVEWVAEYPSGPLWPLVQVKPIHFSPPHRSLNHE